jgi:hypothetical protein
VHVLVASGGSGGAAFFKPFRDELSAAVTPQVGIGAAQSVTHYAPQSRIADFTGPLSHPVFGGPTFSGAAPVQLRARATMGELGQLFSKDTQAIFFNWKGTCTVAL